MKKIIFFLVMACCNSNLQAQVVGVVSNYNAIYGFGGDSGLARYASHKAITGAAFDKDGNEYMVDADNFCIRKIFASTGIIDRIAGSTSNYPITLSASGGTSTTPKFVNLNNLSSIAVDGSNNVYFTTDIYILKLNQTTNILSIFGGNENILFFNDGLAAINTKMLPTNLAFDDTYQNLYFVDNLNNRIRKINMSTNKVYTAYNFSNSGVFATDIKSMVFTHNFLYFNNDQNIYKYVLASNNLSTIATAMPTTGTYSDGYKDIAADINGDIYVNSRYSDGFSLFGIVYKLAGITPYKQFCAFYAPSSGICYKPSCLEGVSSQFVYSSIGCSKLLGFDKCGNLNITGNNATIKLINNIAGNIIDPTLGAIKNVNLQITGSSNETIIAKQGSYYWTPPNTAGGSYTVTPTKPYIPSITTPAQVINGINATDVLFTQRHISNTAPFNNAHKCIAADVDDNGVVDGNDVTAVKNLILANISNLPNNRLFAFINKSTVFSNPNNPFTSTTSPTYNSASIILSNVSSCNPSGLDFYGVKLGDVNFDWNPANARFMNGGSNLELIYLVSNDGLETSNSILRIPVTVNNFNDIVAMQYTLHFDNSKYEYVNIENNMLDINFNCKQANIDGDISMLWVDKNSEEKTYDDGTQLFTLVLKVKSTNQRLTASSQEPVNSIKLGISNKITDVLAWDKTLNEYNITISKQIIDNKMDFVVYPNPTKSLVHILLPKLEKNIWNIKVQDALGRTLHEENTTPFTKNKDVFISNQAGLYYVIMTNKTNNNIVVKKVIVE